MQSLNYTQLTMQADEAVRTEKELNEPAKEQSQPLRPSEMASLSLSYSVVDRPTPNAPEQSREPEQNMDEPDLHP